MAVLYTPEEIQEVLKELRIKPIGGLVSTQEATRILSWRAKAEHGIEHTYNVSAVRSHVQKGNLRKANESTRFSLYKVEDVFEISLAPTRAPMRGQRASTGTADEPSELAA